MSGANADSSKRTNIRIFVRLEKGSVFYCADYVKWPSSKMSGFLSIFFFISPSKLACQNYNSFRLENFRIGVKFPSNVQLG